MAFKSIASHKSEPITAPSWMTQSDAVSPSSPSVITEKDPPKPYPVREEEEPSFVLWKFPEMIADPKVTHIIPKKLERAMVTHPDFANWFETVWMVLSLNARWNLNEAIIPEHLRPLIGARSIGIDGNWKSEKGEVIWSLYL